MEEFRLDRTAFFVGTHEEVEDKDRQEDYSMTHIERLKSAFYLNSVAYNFDINNPPKLDRTHFEIFRRSA